MPWLRYLAFALALGFLALTVVNASWLAPEPKGAVKLIADGGLRQLPAPDDNDDVPCPGTRIEQPAHDYIANTARSIARAAKLGAHVIAVDVTPTADGQIALFADETLDCRTDGTGPVRGQSMAALKALDTGHGFRAEGGTHPLRDGETGAIATLAEGIRAAGRARLLYRFTADDAGEADPLAAALRAAGRDPVAAGDGFHGPPAPIARIAQIHPDAWAFSPESARKCTSAYMWQGWFGIVPAACRGGTLIVPLDRQWAFAGWPNRLVARMEEAGAHVVVAAPGGGDRLAGLTFPEQLGEIPASFNGYALVDDGFTVIPALINRFDDRSQAEIDAAQAALERRRAAR
ncbi:glycerophosphodiester phosphodiesterase family protein [Pelagerythrobacter marinus]|uniref:glycerophosphodiester phosphodiesterase family protein n=1 Tax=Pelagerythrobacter marinus TaxID=538382 RepID=UPI0020369B7C|nr:glycerophosphodiester phosphodiesterase family protein [Pelagerythrobacter marinus]USA39091.1 hypothetical protein NCF86_12420 [Pelagerythrobacter marinus]WPZ06822.1 glycerophosphodiester phosphodiesterase family protein [Pelagerythrobacter marinus]